MKQTLWLSKRVGVIHPDGAREWPAETISGRAYTRPAHTLDITDSAFIVYDAFPDENVKTLIEQARAARTRTDKLPSAGADKERADEA